MFLWPLILFLSTASSSKLSENVFSPDAFTLKFDRENRTYGQEETVKMTLVHDHRSGDPDIAEINVFYISEASTFRRSCDECDVIHTTYHRFSRSRQGIYYREKTMTAGKYEWKVEEHTGRFAPFSFEGPGGWLRYRVNFTVDTVDGRKQAFPNTNVYVMNGTDLSGDPKYEKPLVCEKSAKVAGKQVKVRMELPKNGWVYPEAIPLKVTLENESSWRVEKILGSVHMSQKTYTRKTKTATVENWDTFSPSEAILHNFTVAEGKYEKKISNAKETATLLINHRKKSFIPTTVAPRPEWFRLVEISHSVKASIHLLDPSDDLNVPLVLDCEFPVTFGVVPTKSVKASGPITMVQSDPAYQLTSDKENIAFYPSYENLRTFS